jgi:hypothetical protein
MNPLRMVGWTLLLAIAAGVASGAPLGPGFTYQGQLNLNGNPVNGPTHLRFRLFDALVGGNQIGGAQILASVPVTNGVFTVLLNGANEFGTEAFKGDARWLEIAVCNDPACATSITLAPRQAITATPYSRYSAGPWQKSNTNLTYLDGNVGIGSPNPHTKLELQSGFGTEVLRFGYDDFHHHNIETGFHGGQPPLNYLGFNVTHSTNDIRRVLTLQGDGFVGIGTSTPLQRLHVFGNIGLGTNGEYLAAGGQENLRLLRGGVSAQGAILQGSGYTVFRVSPGVYQISFTPAFGNIPTVTATAFNHGLENRICGIVQQGVSLVTIIVHNASATEVDWGFNFIAIGPR